VNANVNAERCKKPFTFTFTSTFVPTP